MPPHELLCTRILTFYIYILINCFILLYSIPLLLSLFDVRIDPKLCKYFTGHYLTWTRTGHTRSAIVYTFTNVLQIIHWTWNMKVVCNLFMFANVLYFLYKCLTNDLLNMKCHSINWFVHSWKPGSLQQVSSRKSTLTRQ